MTQTPVVDVNAIVPLKYKTWVALVGTLLTAVGPYVIETANLLPSPWPLVVGLIFFVLTTLGVYKAPYKPVGTVLAANPEDNRLSDMAPGTPVAVPVETTATIDSIGDYKNPWRT